MINIAKSNKLLIFFIFKSLMLTCLYTRTHGKFALENIIFTMYAFQYLQPVFRVVKQKLFTTRET